MLIPPNVLHVAGCASRDKARFHLCGIYVERQGERKCSATATDGKTLAHVTWAEDDPSEFPERGVNPLPAEKTGTIIPVDRIKGIVALADPKAHKPILRNVVMDEHTLNGTATFLGTDLSSDRRETIPTVQGTYPDYTKCLAVEPEATVLVNPFLLIQALETFVKTMGWRKPEYNPTAALSLCGDKPISIKSCVQSDREVSVYVMPLIKAPV